eukprot:COSAG05_NODE_11810_length_495_cov_0.888889_1_plen_110_part_00
MIHLIFDLSLCVRQVQEYLRHSASGADFAAAASSGEGAAGSGSTALVSHTRGGGGVMVLTAEEAMNRLNDRCAYILIQYWRVRVRIIRAQCMEWCITLCIAAHVRQKRV